MSKAEEMFQAWARTHRAMGLNRDRTVWNAAWKAKGEADLAAVAATRLVGPGNDSSYQFGFLDACDETERRIKANDAGAGDE